MTLADEDSGSLRGPARSVNQEPREIKRRKKKRRAARERLEEEGRSYSYRASRRFGLWRRDVARLERPREQLRESTNRPLIGRCRVNAPLATRREERAIEPGEVGKRGNRGLGEDTAHQSRSLGTRRRPGHCPCVLLLRLASRQHERN